MRSLRVHTPLYLPLPQILSVLQFRTFGENLLPNLKYLSLHPTKDSLPFIPLLLSPTTTTIDLAFGEVRLHTTAVTSMVTTLPIRCPNLQRINLYSLPRDPTITTAISELLITTNRDVLQSVCVDSPLTEDAREMIHKHHNLRELRAVINEADSLPTLVLPNLVEMDIERYHDCGWLQGFRGATLGKLASVTFRSESHSIGSFLEAFESIALTTSIPATLSKFELIAQCSWRPSYRSLLPFTQLKELTIYFYCGPDCPSTIDDDTITDLAQAMPMLEILHLGDRPCNTLAGVTVVGLAALAHYCLHLFDLRIHFQVASFHPSRVPMLISGSGSTILRRDCALRFLEVGEIRMPKKATLMVALTLLRIFPRLNHIQWYDDERWDEINDALVFSEQFADWSSKGYSFATIPRSDVYDTSPGTALGNVVQ